MSSSVTPLGGKGKRPRGGNAFLSRLAPDSHFFEQAAPVHVDDQPAVFEGAISASTPGTIGRRALDFVK
jgi:hypothetical protein